MKISRYIISQKKVKGKVQREFGYRSQKGGKRITSKEILRYIFTLHIPPAWREVTIFYSPNPNYYKVRATGFDEAGRKQYRYAPWWIKRARNTKLHGMKKFAKRFPYIEKDIKEKLRSRGLAKEKIIALMVALMVSCSIRVGCDKYTALYNSYGVSTLEKRHVRVTGDTVHVKFIGKKGVLNTCKTRDALIAKNIKALMQNKGKNERVFERGGFTCRNTDINEWLKGIDKDFSSKMFRIYKANIELISRLRRLDGERLTKTERKKYTVEVYKKIARIIHNTPPVAKKDYCDSEIADLFIEKPRAWKHRFSQKSTRASFIDWLR